VFSTMCQQQTFWRCLQFPALSCAKDATEHLCTILFTFRPGASRCFVQRFPPICFGLSDLITPDSFFHSFRGPGKVFHAAFFAPFAFFLRGGCSPVAFVSLEYLFSQTRKCGRHSRAVHMTFPHVSVAGLAVPPPF